MKEFGRENKENNDSKTDCDATDSAINGGKDEHDDTATKVSSLSNLYQSCRLEFHSFEIS